MVSATCWVSRHDRPAQYLWVSANTGNRIALCAGCMAAWFALSIDEPDMGASSIEPLTPMLAETAWQGYRA